MRESREIQSHQSYMSIKEIEQKDGHLPPTEVEEAIPWKRINVQHEWYVFYTVETPKGKRIPNGNDQGQEPSKILKTKKILAVILVPT